MYSTHPCISSSLRPRRNNTTRPPRGMHSTQVISIGAVRSDRRGGTSITEALGNTRAITYPLIRIALVGEGGKTPVDGEIHEYNVALVPHDIVFIDFSHREQDVDAFIRDVDGHRQVDS